MMVVPYAAVVYHKQILPACMHPAPAQQYRIATAQRDGTVLFSARVTSADSRQTHTLHVGKHCKRSLCALRAEVH
jgi:hypothetical protein